MKWHILAAIAAFGVIRGITATEDSSSDDYTCSSDVPCEIGCCSNTGVCGLGPDFCGSDVCISSCDYKSECDPGWGSEWSTQEDCPLNVCCSEYGFCGTTSDFCGNKTVTEPSCSGTSSNSRTIGYYEGWSVTRDCDQMYPEGIAAGAYTHLNFAFALIDPDTFEVAIMTDGDQDLYSRLTGLKETYDGLEVWISIGGWSMNDADQPTATTFSDLAASTTAQSSFFASLLKFMTTYGFDGVDIDWEYPVASERGGKAADKANYVSFLKNLKSALGSSGHTYGLSITTPSSYWYLQHFDLTSLAKYVDWFNVMTYDLHGTWDSTDKFIGPIVNSHTNLTEIKLTMDLFWRNDIKPAQITMGLGFYGRSFTLSDPTCSVPGCSFSGGGNPGNCTASAGTLSFAEIERVITAGGVVTLDKAAAVKQVVWDDDQWVSYDDADTFATKLEYADSVCIGGSMIWASSLDNNLATASQALSKKTGHLAASLEEKSVATDTYTACVWGSCGGLCPSGTSAAQRGDGKNKGAAGIYNGCDAGVTRPFCCPSDDMPTCQWRGSAPFCKGKCHTGEVEITSDTAATGDECWTGHKVLCCTATASDAAFGECSWEGSAPICAGISGSASCPSDTKALTTDSWGAGGEEVCVIGSKSYCCSQPAPFTNCEWVSKSGSLTLPFNCNGKCASGKTPIATDPSGCLSGTSYFCCDDPTVSTSPTNDDFCIVPEDVFTGSDELEGDDTTTDYVEYYAYEEDCYLAGEGDTSWNSVSKRSLASDLFMTGMSSKFSHLDKRAKERPQVICRNGPGKNRKTTTNKLYPRGYSGVKVLANAGIKFYNMDDATKTSCSNIAISLGTRIARNKYVAEHVFELQSIKSFIQSMLDGLVASGASLSTGSISWSIFEDGGIFQSSWANLGVTTSDDTPSTTIYKALGTTADKTLSIVRNVDNLQIVDEQLNKIKTSFTRCASLISADTVKALTPAELLGSIKTAFATMNYMNHANAQASYKASYTALKSAFGVFYQALVNSGTSTYDIPTAYTEFMKDWYEYQNTKASAFMTDFIEEQIKVWKDASILNTYKQADVTQALKDLNALQAKISTVFKLKTTWLT